MKSIKIVILISGMFIVLQNAFGQDARPAEVRVVEEAQRQRERQIIRNERNGIDKNGMIKRDVTSPVALKRPVGKRSEENKAEGKIRLEEINQKLSVPSVYENRFDEFLKNKNTGIARIFPDKNCDKGFVVNAQELERCADMPQIKGAGSLYSVRLSDIPNYLPLNIILGYIGFSDIHFVKNKFVVGNKMTQDIISNIGEVDLADISAKSNSFKFLTELKPSKTSLHLQSQNQIFEKGVNSNGYFCSNSADVKLNSTYALRSIAYYEKYLEYENFWNTDLLVAFKVVGQEGNGSVIILWKKLKEKNAPVLKNK
jgi:hypothetical protein